MYVSKTDVYRTYHVMCLCGILCSSSLSFWLFLFHGCGALHWPTAMSRHGQGVS